MVLCLVTLTDL